jgi:antitoxin VapB
LYIRDEQTCALVRELAAALGVSQAAAVRIAVEAKLEQVRSKNAIVQLPELTEEQITRLERGVVAVSLGRIHEISEDTAPRFKSEYASQDHGAILYDESGLPK